MPTSWSRPARKASLKVRNPARDATRRAVKAVQTICRHNPLRVYDPTTASFLKRSAINAVIARFLTSLVPKTLMAHGIVLTGRRRPWAAEFAVRRMRAAREGSLPTTASRSAAEDRGLFTTSMIRRAICGIVEISRTFAMTSSNDGVDAFTDTPYAFKAAFPSHPCIYSDLYSNVALLAGGAGSKKASPRRPR